MNSLLFWFVFMFYWGAHCVFRKLTFWRSIFLSLLPAGMADVFLFITQANVRRLVVESAAKLAEIFWECAGVFHLNRSGPLLVWGQTGSVSWVTSPLCRGIRVLSTNGDRLLTKTLMFVWLIFVHLILFFVFHKEHSRGYQRGGSEGESGWIKGVSGWNETLLGEQAVVYTEVGYNIVHVRCCYQPMLR